MISNKLQIKVNHIKYHRLERLAKWLTNKKKKKETPELAHYIIVHHYHLQEGRAGLL